MVVKLVVDIGHWIWFSTRTTLWTIYRSL